MMLSKSNKPKKPEPNPIEEAIGERTKDPKAQEKFTKEFQEEPIPQSPEQIPDEPSHQEMLTLEELNRQTEERLQEEPIQMGMASQVGTLPQNSVTLPQETATTPQETTTIPVSKPESPPVTKTSSPESPPQEINKIDEYEDVQKRPQFKVGGTPVLTEKAKYIFPPVEDTELIALRKYILEDGFVLSTVAFHIVTLCAEPMTTPSTTTWDFKDRATIPDMVFALLNQPGYIEGIWPSLKIVMGSNKGNSAWSAGIATTIAFFDVVRTLPALKELQNETEKKS